MVVSLDANGHFVRGLDVDYAMAIFLLQNQSDFDVTSDVGNMSGGVGSGLVAAGAYELQSTEFVTDNYSPNDTLTVENAVGADQGKLKKGTPYVDPIVGVVSSGQTDSEHSPTIKFLAFWPVWLPVANIPGN
jgi:2-methylaconitate cis-trans-isomerase PrpF